MGTGRDDHGTTLQPHLPHGSGAPGHPVQVTATASTSWTATGLPDGTVYPILRRLERRGVLEGVWEDEAVARTDQRPARRYYRITPVGEAAMAEVLERFPTLHRLFDVGTAPA